MDWDETTHPGGALELEEDAVLLRVPLVRHGSSVEGPHPESRRQESEKGRADPIARPSHGGIEQLHALQGYPRAENLVDGLSGMLDVWERAHRDHGGKERGEAESS